MKEPPKKWEVAFTGKARKQQENLPKNIVPILHALKFDLEQQGPEITHWPNFGRIQNKKGYFHCHLNKGRPRYVAVWRTEDKHIKVIEVRYVGTHEGINYGRLD